VSRIKPDPEVYHLALETLGVRADEALVFEDSLPGLRAAHAAGIQTVVVRDPWSEADRARLLEEADAHVDSLCDAPEICGFTRS
jgi:HAD hydrolase, family IA, variant 3